MLCIILVAGRGTQLEEDIKNSTNPEHQKLMGIPKALLPGLGDKKIIDYWWSVLKMRHLFSDVYLVTNADKYKHFERWATANDFPVENIINDGTTTHSTRLGSVTDFDLVLRHKKVNDDVMVVAGDMLFEDQNFDISQVVRYFRHKDENLAIYYEMEKCEDAETRGIVEVDVESGRITSFTEKPSPSDVIMSRLASVVFYCFKKETLKTVPEYLQTHTTLEERTFGRYMDWLISKRASVVYGMKLPSRFQLIGQVTLQDYVQWLDYFRNKQAKLAFGDKPFAYRAYARVGLVGNPSDGFFGKTISLSVENFWAEVSIQESRELVLQPHPLNDPTTFGSLQDLHGISRKEGYLGGLRLLQATCKKFYEFCAEKGLVCLLDSIVADVEI